MEKNTINESKETEEISKEEQKTEKDQSQIQDKEPSKEISKENLTTQEENEKIKSELKDENSERSASIPESNGSNSYQNQDNPIFRRDSITDLDKIVPGRDEGRLNSYSLGSNEEKEGQRKSEKDKEKISNFNFGNLYKDFGYRKTITRTERKTKN